MLMCGECSLPLQVVQKIEYPIWVVYVTQALMFGGGLLGISYGILSTSWDPRREGSALGWTELQVSSRTLLVWWALLMRHWLRPLGARRFPSARHMAGKVPPPL